MDKWKDLELDKMKVGGNRKAREFFNSQSDYKPGMSLQEKYNSRAAALYRDKVSIDISTHFSLNKVPHIIYWKSQISVLGRSGYIIQIFVEKNGLTICRQWRP